MFGRPFDWCHDSFTAVAVFVVVVAVLRLLDVILNGEEK